MENYRETFLEEKELSESLSETLILDLRDVTSKLYELRGNSFRTNFYQLIIIGSGKLVLCVDGEQHTLESKSFIGLSKGEVERIDFLEYPQGFVLVFDEEAISGRSENRFFLDNLSLFRRGIKQRVVGLSDLEFTEMFILLKKMQKEQQDKYNYGMSDILSNMLRTIILLAERKIRDNVEMARRNNGDYQILDEFYRLLESKFIENRTVTFYSGELNITPKKLNRVLTSLSGKTAKKIIEERVVLEIKRELVHGNKSVKEISVNLGFDDPSNFNKFFKKYITITPAVYRQMKNVR